jgi:hypothetical protein
MLGALQDQEDPARLWRSVLWEPGHFGAPWELLAGPCTCRHTGSGGMGHSWPSHAIACARQRAHALPAPTTVTRYCPGRDDLVLCHVCPEGVCELEGATDGR